MDLYLSRNSLFSTVLSAVSAGSSESFEVSVVSSTFDAATPVYHIYTPNTFRRNTTTISHISPCVAQNESLKFKSKRKRDVKECTRYEEGVDEIARIYWRMMGPSRIVYKGQIIEVDKFMPVGGFMWWYRTFQGPDGRSYTWRTGDITTHLFVNDGKTKTEIARFHQPMLGALSKTKARLEIKPEGMHMVELIVLTWVFVEKRRRDWQRKHHCR